MSQPHSMSLVLRSMADHLERAKIQFEEGQDLIRRARNLPGVTQEWRDEVDGYFARHATAVQQAAPAPSQDLSPAAPQPARIAAPTMGRPIIGR